VPEGRQGGDWVAAARSHCERFTAASPASIAARTGTNKDRSQAAGRFFLYWRRADAGAKARQSGATAAAGAADLRRARLETAARPQPDRSQTAAAIVTERSYLGYL